MNRIETGRITPSRPSLGIIDLSMEEYDLDDLAGEIARTLEACDALSSDRSPIMHAQDIPQAR